MGRRGSWLRCSDKVAKRGKEESILRRVGCTREQWAEPEESLKRVEGMSVRI